MSEEWVLRQWIAKNGTSAAVACLPASDVEALFALDVNNLFPLDLLAHVLGYTALSDTKWVAQVCRSWFAATRKPQFWSRRIAEKLKAIAATRPQDTLERSLIMRFNTFCFPTETLRAQVEWLFRREWFNVINISQHIGTLISFERYVSDQWSHCVCNSFLRSGQLYCYSTCEYGERRRVLAASETIQYDQLSLKSTIWKHGERVQEIVFVTRGPRPSTFIGQGQAIRIGELEGSGIGIWIDDNGAPIVGRTMATVPHGDGKWTFADGTVLEGKGVAWKGKPRWSEPPEPVTKRRKAE